MVVTLRRLQYKQARRTYQGYCELRCMLQHFHTLRRQIQQQLITVLLACVTFGSSSTATKYPPQHFDDTRLQTSHKQADKP